MGDKKPIDKLVFLEFTEEAETFIRKYGGEIRSKPDSFRIVSFHPKVKSYLRKASIFSEDSFNFCDTASHKKLLVELEGYTERVRKCCDIKEDLSGVRESYVRNLVLSMRSLLSVWLYRAEVIANAVEYYCPKAVISAGYEVVKAAPTVNTHPSDRYLADIISQVCADKKYVIRQEIIRLALRDRLNIKGLAIVSFWNMACRFLRYFAKIGRNTVIVPAEGHNIDVVVDDLKKELGGDYEIAFLESPRIAILKDALRYVMKKGKRPHKYLFCNMDRKVRFTAGFLKERQRLRDNMYDLIDSIDYRGISTAKWLKSKYRLGLEPEVIDKTYYQAANLSRFLDKNKPKFVLSQYARGMTAVMGELCRSKRIPSLVIPHGSFTPAKDEYSKKDWKENALGVIDTYYEYVALQTPLVEKFLSDIPVESKPVITGPLVFGRANKISEDVKELKRRYARRGEKIILHASTPKPRDGQRFFNYETTDEYVESMASLVRAAERIGNLHVIVRYRPIDGLDTEDLRDILPASKSYSIAAHGRFFDYLAISDLVVSYSSTAMEEALQNDIPVLLYNRYNRNQRIMGRELCPGSADIRPSAVYNVNSEDHLEFALVWILRNHLSSANLQGGLFDEYKYKKNDTVRLSDLIRKTARR